MTIAMLLAIQVPCAFAMCFTHFLSIHRFMDMNYSGFVIQCLDGGQQRVPYIPTAQPYLLQFTFVCVYISAKMLDYRV